MCVKFDILQPTVSLATNEKMAGAICKVLTGIWSLVRYDITNTLDEIFQAPNTVKLVMNTEANLGETYCGSLWAPLLPFSKLDNPYRIHIHTYPPFLCMNKSSWDLQSCRKLAIATYSSYHVILCFSCIANAVPYLHQTICGSIE